MTCVSMNIHVFSRLPREVISPLIYVCITKLFANLDVSGLFSLLFKIRAFAHVRIVSYWIQNSINLGLSQTQRIASPRAASTLWVL